MYQVLYRKWRPAFFSEVVGQEHITTVLKNQVKAQKTAHAYLFSGTRGSGKTTCARILAKAINCLNPIEGEPCGRCSACLDIQNDASLDITEIDAASNNGVDNIRALRDESVFTPAALKMRVYIIDEVHMLSTGAFNALLKLLEEPPAHLLFILATTEIHKVPATILSRCQRFDFRRIAVPLIEEQLRKISRAEGWEVEDGAVSMIARIADGALRNALSLLEQSVGTKRSLTADNAAEALGLSGGRNLLEMGGLLKENDLPALFSLAGRLYDGGAEVSAIIDEMFLLMRDMLMIRALGKNAQISGAGYDYDGLSALAREFSTDRLIYSMRLLQDTAARLAFGMSKRAELELCLFRLCNPAGHDPEILAARVDALERMAAAFGGSAPAKPSISAPSSGRSNGSAKEQSNVKPAVPETPSATPAAAPSKPSSAGTAPKPAAPSSLPDGFSNKLEADLSLKLNVLVFSHFRRTSLELYGETLVIIPKSGFDLDQLNHRPILGTIAECACSHLGFVPRIELRLEGGETVFSSAPPPPQTGDNDSLHDLAALSNEFGGVVTIE